MLKSNVVILCAAAFLLQTCNLAKKAKIKNAAVAVPVVTREILALKDTSLQIGTGTNGNIKILYTGCGGLVIAYMGEVFMTDPYYTAHDLAEVLITGIKPNRDKELTVLSKIRTFADPKKISNVLVSHSHYDHLEDLPGLLKEKDLAPSVSVWGSRSTSVTLQNFLTGHVFVDACKLQYKHSSRQAGIWTNISPHIKILPIESEHAPHFYLNVKGMQGCTKSRKFKKFKEPFQKKTSAGDWREGCTYSYLVDFYSADLSQKFRLFLQGTSSCWPLGSPPQTELDQKKVDLAILCMASYDYVLPNKNYPNAILEQISPQKTLIIHWEDFFKDFWVHEPMVVPLTDETGYMNILRRLSWMKGKNLKDHFIMPAPGRVVEVGW